MFCLNSCNNDDLTNETSQNESYTTGLPVDRVSGYTLGQIQSALNTSRTLNDWKTRLLNSTNNPTQNFIDDVFDYAQSVRNNNL